MEKKRLAPVHPGEVLREDFLLPLELSPYAVARACGVPRTRIERIARERAPITADSALRLARFFGTTPDFLDEHPGAVRPRIGGGRSGRGYCANRTAQTQRGIVADTHKKSRNICSSLRCYDTVVVIEDAIAECASIECRSSRTDHSSKIDGLACGRAPDGCRRRRRQHRPGIAKTVDDRVAAVAAVTLTPGAACRRLYSAG